MRWTNKPKAKAENTVILFIASEWWCIQTCSQFAALDDEYDLEMNTCPICLETVDENGVLTHHRVIEEQEH